MATLVATPSSVKYGSVRLLPYGDVVSEADNGKAQQQRTRGHNLGTHRRLVAWPHLLPIAKYPSAMEQKQVPGSKKDCDDLGLKDRIEHIKAGHPDEHEYAGDDIDGESGNPPGQQAMEWAYGDFLQEPHDANVQ